MPILAGLVHARVGLDFLFLLFSCVGFFPLNTPAIGTVSGFLSVHAEPRLQGGLQA